MLSNLPNLNPAIRREAELFTDGRLTDAVVERVAARLGLPLLVPVMDAPAPRMDAIAAAQREVAEAEAVLRNAVHCFDVARKELGKANARALPPICKGKLPRPIPTATRLRLQSEAMAFLNTRRGMKRRAEKRLAAARAALLAVVS